MKIKIWVWVIVSGVLGFLVPAGMITLAYFFDMDFSKYRLLLWPVSFELAAVEGVDASTMIIVLVNLVVMIENVVVYAVAGCFIWIILNFLMRRAGMGDSNS